MLAVAMQDISTRLQGCGKTCAAFLEDCEANERVRGNTVRMYLCRHAPLRMCRVSKSV